MVVALIVMVSLVLELTLNALGTPGMQATKKTSLKQAVIGQSYSQALEATSCGQLFLGCSQVIFLTFSILSISHPPL